MRSANRETRVDGDVTTAVALVRSALEAVGARITSVDPASRVQARVRVHVETALPLTLVDWGATRDLADRIVRALADPTWAAGLLTAPGPSPLVRASIWLGVVAAGASAWAAAPSRPHEQRVLLVAAVVAAVLWTAAILLGALRVRRRGETFPPWQMAIQLGALFIIGFPTADALQPRHASVTENFSATLSAAIGATAVAALIMLAVRRIRHRT